MKEQLLKQSSYFAALTDQELAKIKEIMFTRQYQEGEFIFFEGEVGEGLFFIKSGKVKLTKMIESGKEQILNIFKAGDMFAEVVLFDQGKYPATAVVIDDSEIGVISKEDMEEIMRNYPEITIKILRVMGKRLRRAQERIRNLGLKNTKSRTASILVHLAQEHGWDNKNKTSISLSLSQQDLAGLIGSSRETISRVLSKLKKEDLVDVSREKIVIKDLIGLKKII
ncbi:cAMP-binding protein [Halobacteroides halobius DSM 5150]|uniref:cAMP-binding protein n=1 Tax=Halobacteroides halobius (strain ATCC 35273 / DSM 5150 / MD-1) TaxID=748449 RepID=L0KAU1_HALHC|nr:Crp/Fnr family transcriptional regulator [Halobacteroides halobius]AGB41208.1 cAMP-binding protein [Halobacteroides halobius DSM 5150]